MKKNSKYYETSLHQIKLMLSDLENKDIIIECDIQRFGKTNVYKKELAHVRAVCIENIEIEHNGTIRELQHVWIDELTSPKLKGIKLSPNMHIKLKGRVKSCIKKTHKIKSHEPTLGELFFKSSYKQIDDNTLEYKDYYIVECELIEEV